MTSQLQQLKIVTNLAIDTADIDAIGKYSPSDATTNPSLIFNAAKKPQYAHLLTSAYQYSLVHATSSQMQEELFLDKLSVNFGVEILRLVSGGISTEMDARLAYNASESIQRAHKLIELYQEMGVAKEKVLIKLPATWEGIEAARQLEQEGIRCNMTLMFSLEQAIASAEAKATMIAPYVGRISDWHKAHHGINHYPASEDPGVKTVTQIYQYLKTFGYPTRIMGASFRNKEQILALAGCDLLTIAPSFFDELNVTSEAFSPKLSSLSVSHLKRMELNEQTFRKALNANKMASEKLQEGIQKFIEDTNSLIAIFHAIRS